jgi:hypothetical protein
MRRILLAVTACVLGLALSTAAFSGEPHHPDHRFPTRHDGHAFRRAPSITNWESLGSKITESPVAVSWSADRLDLFVRGTDGGVWHKWWDGSQWGDWESLGGQIIGPISAVSWSADRLDLFVRGTDGAVWHKWWDGAQWGPS